ncbi:hypothetical protein [Marininema halotolerans]|uniref:Uncharacterized protein n=1 Tax=Marininema halotolerans TaxID=1155944 RepID=A0A1I6PQ95_9BACL|nr:hypothetical protein [Marininema halotolerans]SFS42238.1 hypothetical protein SAMN05444972_10257 [Marininema halotolerans]
MALLFYEVSDAELILYRKEVGMMKRGITFEIPEGQMQACIENAVKEANNEINSVR